MDIAIVTGASSSLGLAISRRLIQLGFRVYGLGGDYTDCPLQNVNFRPVSCNLADPAAVESAGKRILEKEKGVLVLVNNAKYFGSQYYLDMSPEEMQRVLNINLLCPLVLARTLAEGLMSLQGYVIQLGPLHVESSRGGPSGAAAAGGLKWMSELLFQDLREYGVKVCHLSPEPNRGRDPRTSARQGTKVTAAIDPEAVAQALEQLLQSPYGNIVTEMVMRPLRVSEPDHDPVVKLPYPKPKPVPYTVPREMIEAEDQLEEEEFQKKQKEKRSRRQESQKKTAVKKTTRKKAEKRAEEPVEESVEEPMEDADEKQTKPTRRKQSRRKTAKVRSDEHASTDSRPVKGRSKAPEPEREKVERKAPEPERKMERKAPEPERKAPESESITEKGPRRRSRRKPRPPRVEVGFHKEITQEKPTFSEKKDKPESPSEAPKKEQSQQRKRPARKKAGPAEKTEQPSGREGNKPAKKPVEKSDSAKKKVPAKKAARKSVRKVAKKAARNPEEKAHPARKVPRKRTAKKAKPDAKSD